MSAKVRVTRNPLSSQRAKQPWLVSCDICAGSEWFSALLGRGAKGWAPTWRVAQDYAIRHALEHEKTQCPTCLHVPTEPLPSERGANA